MTLNDKKDLILQYFDEILPNPGCELTYNSDYGFLIAVMLSAQCTDKKVNKVTDVLFKKYDTLEKLDKAPIEELEEILKPLGLYKAKAKNVKEITNSLLTNYDGKVPTSKEELMKLKGVGNKSSNVVRIELFELPEFPVDTHVFRTAKRLGLVNQDDDILEVEHKLKNIFDEDLWIKLHHQFIHFGRYYCKAMKPDCTNCKLRGICTYNKKSDK